MNESQPSPDRWPAVSAYAKKNLLPHWPNLFLILMKNVIGSLLYMVPPFLSKYILETVFPEQNWNLLITVTICMVAAPIIGSMMIILEDVWGRFMIRLAGRGRADLYNGIQHRPLGWLHNNRTGDLLTRILDDTHSITDLVNGHLGFMLFHIVTITAGSAVLLVLEPTLASIVLILWAGQATLVKLLGRHVKQKAAETARHKSLVSESVREIISGAAFIKAAGKESKAIGHLRDCLRQEWNHTRREVLADHKVRLLHASLNASFLVFMYTAGGWLVLQNKMTIGSLVAFVAVYNWLRPFGISLIDMVIGTMKVIPSMERVTDIAFPVRKTNAGSIPQGPITLETRSLSFRYDSRPILDDVSFQVPSGSIVSIVGYRGSGKSTLVDLLLGLYEPVSGCVCLNGIPLPQLDPAWLRSQVLCVSQDVRLRSGTILDNIVFGRENIGMEEVWEAVRLAQLDDWISRLPDGLFTRVGEQALQISGGERQRISIARALLRKPAILIFDEATSALDQGTERRLLKQMINELKGVTLLFITHRLDVTQQSDEVLVLHEGRLVDRGSPEELRSRPGIYQELWVEQQTPLTEKNF